jgi:hypothetical protein
MASLSERLQQSDMTGLNDAQVVAALNTPDPTLPAVRVPFSCPEIAIPAALSGELATLRIVAARGQIPADLTPNNTAIPLSTQAIAVILTMLDAVDRNQQVSPEMDAGQVAAMFDNVEAMGLLSPATKTAILSQTFRSPSWAEAQGVKVTLESVGLARAVLQSVTLLGWVYAGPAPGGGVIEQARIRLPDGTESAPIFKLPMAENQMLRDAALNQWLNNNANLLS